MSTKEELACVYAALLLQDDGVAVTGDKIQSVLKAAGVEIDPFWPGLFAKALEGVDVKNLITNVTSGVGVAAPGGGAPAGGAPAGGKAEAKEEKKEPEKKKEEPKEESDEDMGFGLFD